MGASAVNWAEAAAEDRAVAPVASQVEGTAESRAVAPVASQVDETVEFREVASAEPLAGWRVDGRHAGWLRSGRADGRCSGTAPAPAARSPSFFLYFAEWNTDLQL